MSISVAALLRVLVVEPDNELRDLLCIMLREEGYAVQAAASLGDALRLLDEQAFRLALADLFMGHAKQSFTEANILRRRAHPIPVGLLTTQKIEPAEALRQGFAFLVHKPFEVEELLSTLASIINQPLSEEQARQAEVVRRFFSALQDADWATLATLCSEDITYYPSTTPPASKKIRGFSAYHAFGEKLLTHLPGFVFEEALLFARPKGLAARYTGSWLEQDGKLGRLTGAALFHFEGARISQIGVRLDTERLYAIFGSACAG